MTTHRAIVAALSTSAESGESVVLATVVRVIGSSYGGVGARMVIRFDGSTVGLVSGGCLESDLCEHALRVHGTGRAEVVTYDIRADDEAVWGLGLGCNGLIDVLLEPLSPAGAKDVARLLNAALTADAPSVLATVVQVSDGLVGAPAVGAHALLNGDAIEPAGNWGESIVLPGASADFQEALEAGRHGLVRDYDGVHVAFEVVMPAVRLVICGSGPDVVPLARFASQLGWDATVVDNRPAGPEHPERFPGAQVIECADALGFAETVELTPRTAAVVMSHHFERDTNYVQALLDADVAYIGVLGPRKRTERMLAEIASRSGRPVTPDDRFFGPVGLDIGGEGPDAIALSIVSQIAAVTSGREGGHVRDRRAPLHAPSRSTEPASST